MAIATYKDLCIDAVDPARARQVLGGALRPRPRAGSRTATPSSAADAERTRSGSTRCPSRRPSSSGSTSTSAPSSSTEVEALGGTVVDADDVPLGGHAGPRGRRALRLRPVAEDTQPGLMEMVVDTSEDHRRTRRGGASVLGVRAQDDSTSDGFSYLEHVPGCPSRRSSSCPSPSRRSSRTGSTSTSRPPTSTLLVDARRDACCGRRTTSIGWNVLADPEGNEFCAFVGALD